MRFKCNKIMINDLQLYPSTVYSATIDGVFDFDKTNSFADTVSDGKVFGHSKINEKNMTLNVIVKKYNDLKSHLYLNHILSQKNIKLVLDYDYLGTIEATVNVVSKSTSSDFGGTISVALVSAEPYFYTVEESIFLGVVYSKGLSFPAKMPFKFDEAITGNIGQIENKGYSVTYPVIEISGACDSGFILENMTTKQTNTFNIKLGENDVLKIDCRQNTLGVYLNGVRQNNFKLETYYHCVSGMNKWKFTRNTPVESVRNCKISLKSRVI